MQNKFGYKIKVQQLISSGQTLIMNLCCDLDLEHSQPKFSLDTSVCIRMIYHQTKFVCKSIISSEDTIKTVIFWLIKPHCDLNLQDSIQY